MSNEVIQETTPLVECSAFHLGMSVLEASLRNTENSEAIISGLLKGAAEFYGASRASVVEADWDLGIGVITYEWCKDGVSAQRDMLQCLPMEKFPRWRKALRANKPVVISDLQRLEKAYTAMADKNSLIRQITAAMETELIPFPGGTISLGDIERRLSVLEQQFQTLLEKATDDPAAYGGQFKEILDEQTFLKEKRSGILADNKEQAKANQRIMDAAQTLENASPHITEWDESAVRQLVETVKVLSKDEIAVTLKGGIEICQKK